MRQRKHIRLRDFDYRSADSYFITICTKNFDCLFGEIRNGIVGFSETGNIAAIYLQQIAVLRNGVLVDEFVVMPNHIHLILTIGKGPTTAPEEIQFAKPVANSVSVIINRYKGAVKKWCNANGYPHFEWQSRFYDHIIRNQESYDRIVTYIQDNPRSWDNDKYCI